MIAVLGSASHKLALPETRQPRVHRELYRLQAPIETQNEEYTQAYHRERPHPP